MNAPTKLHFTPLTVADVPFQVLDNAYWRPQAAKLHGKHKEALAALSGAAAEKTYQKLAAAWRKEETWINHALNALLSALPEAALATLMADFCGGTGVDEPQVSRLDSGGMRSTTGDPDFVVVGTRTCVLGECKVAAQPGSHRYSFEQFTKYQSLGAILACARDETVRREPVHLILVPDPEPREICSDYKAWHPGVEGGRLVVDARRVSAADKKRRYDDATSWREFVRSTLLEKRVQSRCEVDPERVEALLVKSSPVLVPTFVVTWGEAMSRIRELADGHGCRNLGRAATALAELAYGPEGDRLDKFVAKNVIFTD